MAELNVEHDVPVTSFDDLVAPLFDACKPKALHRIGAEAEKFGVDAKTGLPIPYAGERGVVAVMSALTERYGWSSQRESDGGPLISLTRDGASVTLEPGAQLELSGAPLDDIHAIAAELKVHIEELEGISRELDLAWLGVGFHPYALQDELPWVPKLRYGIMRRYLPARGRYGLDMMRRTCTVQANFDYENEASAMRVLRTTLRLSPIVTAIFANSPFYEGRPFGGRSYRARVWLSVDPDRQGLVRQVLEGRGGFGDYVEWALDAPMFLFTRGSRGFENTGQSFRSFMKHGFEGQRATLNDWLVHINTLFPEVRLKRTLEVRGADSLPLALAPALPALWTGILYDEQALAEASELVADYGYDELSALRTQIPERALAAELRGAPIAGVAAKVVEIARGGLARRRRLDDRGRDERAHLDPIAELVAEGKCPADRLLERAARAGLDSSSGGGDPRTARQTLIETCRV